MGDCYRDREHGVCFACCLLAASGWVYIFLSCFLFGWLAGWLDGVYLFIYLCFGTMGGTGEGEGEGRRGASCNEYLGGLFDLVMMIRGFVGIMLSIILEGMGCLSMYVLYVMGYRKNTGYRKNIMGYFV